MTSRAVAEPGPIRFRPGLAATFCALLGVLVLLGLATWQVQRLHWKTGLIAAAESRFGGPPVPLAMALADPADNDWRLLAGSGRYRNDLAFAMGAVAENGEIGARLVTPLDTGSGALVLVERGWLPERLLPPKVPAELQLAGEVTIMGHARDRAGDRAGPFTPANQPERRRWYSYDLPAIGRVLGAEVAPLVVTLDAAGDATALPHPLPLTIDLPNNHLGYAITWYGLAAGLAAVYIAFGLRRSGD